MSKQVLSAAVDAAATEAEWDALLEAAARDPAIKAEWSRIWALRDVRDNVALAAGDDFCSGVMAAIANEKPLPSTVVQMPLRQAAPPPARRARPARTWRTLVPLSAAAGVVAAVLVVGGLRGIETDNSPALTASSTAVVATTPVSFNPEALPDDAKAAILNAYLIEHSNSIAERSMGGALANARFAARTADYRPDTP